MAKHVFMTRDKVWLFLHGEMYAGVIKHISTTPGLPSPYVVEYRNARGDTCDHNASYRQLEPRD